jgi:hypothetical protein
MPAHCLTILLAAVVAVRCYADTYFDAAIDSLLGSNFSSEFYTCGVNSSETSWCQASNPYVIAQPLVFTYESSIAPAPAPGMRFQRMRDNYRRSFVCDGEEATSSCRMVDQFVVLENIAVAPRRGGHLPYCSVTPHSCETFQCDLPGCKECQESQDICENLTWCAAPGGTSPAPSSSPASSANFSDVHIVGVAQRQWSPDEQQAISTVSFFDAKLNVMAALGNGTTTWTGGTVDFVSALADPATGFKYVVVSIVANGSRYDPYFKYAEEMGLSGDVPHDETLYLQVTSPNPLLDDDSISSWLICDLFTIAGMGSTDYGTKVSHITVGIAGIGVGFGFVVTDRLTGKPGIYFVGIQSETRVISNTGSIFLDISGGLRSGLERRTRSSWRAGERSWRAGGS